jgi:integrase
MSAPRTSDHRYSDRITLRRRGKKGTWVAHFTHLGSHAKRSLKTAALPTARAAAAKLEKELLLGTLPSSSDLTLGEAVDRYLASRRLDGLSPGTLRGYEAEMGYLREFARRHRIARPVDITPAALDAFARYRVDSPGRRFCFGQNAAAAAHKARLHAKMLLRWLSDRDLVASNPLARVRLKRPRQVRPSPPSMADALRIVAAAPPRHARYLAVLAFTGTRIHSLTRISPGDVDLDAGFLRLLSEKTRAYYSVPIHPRLRPFLEAAVAEAGASPVLFSRDATMPAASRRPLNNGTVRNRLRTLARSLGLATGRAEQGWTPHVFRHAFETHCVNSGVSQHVVDLWMCHAGNRSTSAGYFHLTPAASKRHMDGLSFPEPGDTTCGPARPAPPVDPGRSPAASASRIPLHSSPTQRAETP